MTNANDHLTITSTILYNFRNIMNQQNFHWSYNAMKYKIWLKAFKFIIEMEFMPNSESLMTLTVTIIIFSIAFVFFMCWNEIFSLYSLHFCFCFEKLQSSYSAFSLNFRVPFTNIWITLFLNNFSISVKFLINSGFDEIVSLLFIFYLWIDSVF